MGEYPPPLDTNAHDSWSPLWQFMVGHHGETDGFVVVAQPFQCLNMTVTSDGLEWIVMANNNHGFWKTFRYSIIVRKLFRKLNHYWKHLETMNISITIANTYAFFHNGIKQNNAMMFENCNDEFWLPNSSPTQPSTMKTKWGKNDSMPGQSWI